MVQGLDANARMGPLTCVRQFFSRGCSGRDLLSARGAFSTAVRAALDHKTRALDLEVPGGADVARSRDTERNTQFLRQPGRIALRLGAVGFDAGSFNGVGRIAMRHWPTPGSCRDIDNDLLMEAG